MEERKVIYTNSIGVSASIFDVRLSINYISNNNEEREKKDFKKENICEIAMSPQHAKAFLNVLKGTVQQYEEAFGEIKLNDSVEERGK